MYEAVDNYENYDMIYLDFSQVLQGDLSRLYEWTEKQQMQFNVSKCGTLNEEKNSSFQ